MQDTDLSGRTFSRYRIVKLLGAGGMGQVYLAEDTQLERTVALKILPAEVSADQERMRRFVREAKAASAIDHPSIVHIYEVGESEGVHFIAMQYVEGETLHKKISGHPVPNDSLIPIAIQVADVLAETHSRGIIHRDLKPGNIMITSKGNAKLLDFGLARMERGESGLDSKMATMSQTESGVVVGTVAYMSPEQAMGNRVDARTDIFSLGIVLYEMTTGRLPFIGKNPVETIDKIVHSQPDPILRLNYEAPQELERIIRKCLEKDANLRYQSASEISIDLKNLKRDLDSSPSSQLRTPSSLQEVTAATSSKIRTFFIPLALILLLAGLAAFLLLRQRTASSSAVRSLAVLPFKNVNLDPKSEYLSDGITDGIINNLSQLKELRVMARSTVFGYKNKEVDPREIGKKLDIDAVIAGNLLQQGDDLVVNVDFVDARDGRQIWGKQYNRKMAGLLQLQSQISKEISESLRIQISGKERNQLAQSYTENSEAYQLFLQAQFFFFQRTVDGTKKAINLFQQSASMDPNFALAYEGLGRCYLYLGISGAGLGGLPPREVMPLAKENTLKALQLDDTLSDAHVSLGNLEFNYGWNWKLSQDEFRKALELNPSNYLAYLHNGLCSAALGNKELALKSFQRLQKLDPGYSPSSVFPIGIGLYWMRDYDGALKYFQKSLEMDARTPSPNFWMGLTYLEKGDNVKATASFQRAVDLTHGSPVALMGLGICYARQGKANKSETILSQILDQSKQIYIPEFYLACLYASMGRKDEAFEWLDKGYKARANGMSLLRVVPLVDNLRSDPRFTELLVRMNLQ